MDETKDSTERRVVLIKPGDVLLIGGLTITPQQFSPLQQFFADASIRVAVFADEISIDTITAESLARLSGGES